MGQVLEYSATGELVQEWAALKMGFNNVMGVTAGNDGMVYVAESSGQRVQQLDASGHYIRSFDLGCSPAYLAANGEWIDASCSRGVMSINTKTGEVQRSRASDNNYPGTPAGITYGPDGTLYILDFGVLVACKVQH